jgi:hypothetical protein
VLTATLHATKSGLVVQMAASKATFALPSAGSLELVVAVADGGLAARCSSAAAVFRKAGKRGLRAP